MILTNGIKCSCLNEIGLHGTYSYIYFDIKFTRMPHTDVTMLPLPSSNQCSAIGGIIAYVSVFCLF